MAGKLPAIRAVQWDCQWPLKHNGNSHPHIAHKPLWPRQSQPYIYTNQSQKGDARQLEAMSYTPLTVLLPPGKDCVAVW